MQVCSQKERQLDPHSHSPAYTHTYTKTHTYIFVHVRTHNTHTFTHTHIQTAHNVDRRTCRHIDGHSNQVTVCVRQTYRLM